jgi:hypothetical protein
MQITFLTINKIHKILLGFQPRQVASVSLRTRTEMVLETSVLSTFNHLMWLEAQENFINFSRRESLKSYISNYC